MATRWGCIGPGKISSDFFRAMQENLPKSDHEFIAVGSKDEGRAKAFAEKFGFKKAYASYDEFAQDKDVEIVYIGTLHTTHVDLSIKMLKAGKHVICEKPMALNSKQAKQVHAVAKAENRLFMEAAWSSWFPIYKQIRNEVSDGTLGDTRLVLANFCIPIGHVERMKRVDMGGGGLLDIGIYVVHLACHVFREMPESITAVGNIVGEVDGNACILLKYKNGAMANLTYHIFAGQGVNSASILGTKGRIDINSPFHCPTEMTSTVTGSHNLPFKDAGYNFINSAGLQFEAAAARECIKAGLIESPDYTHADCEMIHEIMDEVRRQIGMKYPDID